MSIKLSICIPTYNRGDFIAETIQSIIDQATNEIEIVISDNASVDNTKELVAEFQAIFPNITYFRWSENMGADRNFLKVIELASGTYCWFMGSDDKVESNAISTVLMYINKFPEMTGMSVNRHAYAPNLKNRIIERPATSLQGDKHFENAGDCFAVLGHYFGYISAQIVHREKWLSIAQHEDLTPYFNAYVHIYVIGRMLQKYPNWLYVHTPCVGWRSGNDSFLSEGKLKRLAIDVYGYEKIARDLFGKRSHPYDELLKTVASVHVWYAILGAKLTHMPFDFFWKAFTMSFEKYKQYPIFWFKTFPLFLIPSFLLTGARSIYRLLWKNRQLQKINQVEQY